MEHNDTRDLITTAAAASILGLTPSALSAWRREKKGPPFYAVGGVYRYDRREVIEYRESLRTDPAAEVA